MTIEDTEGESIDARAGASEPGAEVPGPRGALSVTFRGIPLSEELLFYARRLGSSLSCDIALDVGRCPEDEQAVRVELVSDQGLGRVRVERRGHAFLAVRDAFEELERRSSAPRPGWGS